jgi:hypothetical protein
MSEQIDQTITGVLEKVMAAHREHTISLVDHMLGFLDNLKITIHDDKGNPHEIVLLQDVVRMLGTVKEGVASLPKAEYKSLDSDG